MSALFHSQSARAHHGSGRVVASVLSALLASTLIAVGCGPSTGRQLTEIRALQEAGQYDASIAPLRKVIANDSDHPEANLRLGIALRQTGRPSLAVWPLQKASLTDEYGLQAGLLLASTLAAGESYQEAIRAYRRVLEDNPSNTTALFGLGQAQLSIGQPAAALESAEAYLSVRPES